MEWAWAVAALLLAVVLYHSVKLRQLIRLQRPHIGRRTYLVEQEGAFSTHGAILHGRVGREFQWLRSTTRSARHNRSAACGPRPSRAETARSRCSRASLAAPSSPCTLG